VARELLEHDYDLLCPVRDPGSPAARRLKDLAEALPKGALMLRQANLIDPAACGRDLQGLRADALVSCIASRSGGLKDSEQVEYEANRNLLHWAQSNDVEHFTLLSAICVQKPRLAFQWAKLRFEGELEASGLAYSIVRPTAFFKSLSGQLGRVKAGKPFLLFGDGQLTRCKPIAEADLAQFLRLTLEDKHYAGLQPIGGPGPAITPLAQAEMLARLTGQTLRTRSVPPGLLAGIAATLTAPGKLFSQLADKAEFARIGHYYATESMLLWDPIKQCYEEAATPEFGSITLEESYKSQLAGDDSQALGTHAMFD
jgi:divinyl chlorophyllide a 8-vinyl-reductase